ncbi:type II toxin-antitoxin system VapC family toxin [Segnochrobactrum spirostomi]|uniref:Ribonuclease VapC n=1 Tax=Segnochrobactrum spirostomi TaxID=2608987 RepID=A0A6A7Y7X7_9HYPH|nr:type II toxin-antitoxin system VapC family toxin [Segnochrobactrum spirostomi]MQT14098.1 type II toxin-antitoxin system VapC family toxin [Segnochrobactrum spirostomi]
MILLDTNVVSELMRSSPDGGVEAWVGRRNAADLFLSSISVAELLYGAALLPAGRRRDAISNAIRVMVDEDFSGRILDFDRRAAGFYADIAAARRRSGRPISHADAQIAAIARAASLRLATRNVVDFAGCDLDVVNQWSDD